MRLHIPAAALVLIIALVAVRHHSHASLDPGHSRQGRVASTAWTPISTPAAGDSSGLAACAQDLPNGQAPSYDNVSIAPQLHVLCYQAFVVGHFAPTRTPLWSAEFLTPERIRAARQQRRVNVFHPDPQLSPNERAELSDYVRSGYDRGHLSPSGDQPSPASQAESFTLANMAPQNPGLNRGPWEELESSVRNLAANRPVYVITGVRFVGAQIAFLKNRVGIPTTYYKLVYDPASRAATVFEAANQEGGTPQGYAVSDFERVSGIHFGLGDVTLLSLPGSSPSPYRGGAE